MAPLALCHSATVDLRANLFGAGCGGVGIEDAGDISGSSSTSTVTPANEASVMIERRGFWGRCSASTIIKCRHCGGPRRTLGDLSPPRAV